MRLTMEKTEIKPRPEQINRFCELKFTTIWTTSDECLKARFPPGSLLVERAPGRQPVANPPMPPRGEGSSGSLSAASQQQRQSTLAQLQMQVDPFSLSL